MAKMIRHDYGAIHDALNKMIIAEVKAALELLPGKRIEADGQVPLCRIVVSPDCDYSPRNMRVMKLWVDNANVLHIKGLEGNEDLWMEEYTEDDDLLDITDFGYLINQIAEKVEGDATYSLPDMSLLTYDYVAALLDLHAVEQVVTV